MLKKCKQPDDVLFINAGEHHEKGKRQNSLLPENIDKIVDAYQYRKEVERYSRRVSMEEIEKNEYNLNISRYITTAEPQPEIDLQTVNQKLNDIKKRAIEAEETHNRYLTELGMRRI